MNRTPTFHFRPLRAALQLAALATAACVAAGAWAAGLPSEEGLMLDTTLFRDEVAGAPAGHWPTDGWYRVALGEKAVSVRAVAVGKPGADDEDAWYVRIPGTALKAGARPLYRMTPAVAQPRIGREYQMMLGRTPFAFTVDASDGALAYTVRYEGGEAIWRIGLPDTPTTIVAIADLDGDGRPDFVVDAGEQTFLLLSSTAKPGVNAPAAELWAAHGGC